MKKNYISALVKGGWICGCIACMISCGPVHRFTRIKNVPREYMRNYSVEGVKVPRSQTLFRHTPWIVFAREAGTTYLSPSGKNEMQAVEYMDAFLVIKRKGDWLRLDQPERPVADPERLYRCRYRIQEQAGGHADRHPGVCRSRYLFFQRFRKAV